MRKKLIITIVVALIIGVTSLILEATVFPRVTEQTDVAAITFPEAEISIRETRNSDWQPYTAGTTPRYLRADEPHMLNFYDSIFSSAAQDTQYKLVEVNRELVHVRLLDGELLIDTRFSQQTTFWQTDTVAVAPGPFSQFILRYNATLDITEVQPISGYLIVKEYTNYSDKEPQEYFLTPILTYDSVANERLAVPKTGLNETAAQELPQLNTDAYLRANTSIKVDVNGTPEFPGSKFLTFNPVKRYQQDLISLSQNLDAAREYTAIQQSESAQKSLSQFADTLAELIANSPQTIRPYYQDWLLLYGGIKPGSAYQPIQAELLKVGVTILRNTELVNLWLPAVEQTNTWSAGSEYLAIVQELLAETEDSTVIGQLVDRIAFQLGSYPQKHNQAAFNLLKDSVGKFYELEEPDSIRAELDLAKLELVADSLAADSSNLQKVLVDTLELVYQQADREESFTDYRIELLGE